MSITKTIINNIETECVIQNIKPLVIQFRFHNVPNDISLNQLISHKCMEARITQEILDTCMKAGCIENNSIHIINNINFQINYININSKKLQIKCDNLIKSIEEVFDSAREDERRHKIVDENLQGAEIKLPGVIPVRVGRIKIMI